MHILPWQPAALAELPGRPRRSIVDDVLAPLSRAEVDRELALRTQLDAAHSDDASAPKPIPITIEE